MELLERSLPSGEERAPEETWRGRVVYQVYPNTFHEVRPPGQEHTGRGSILGVIERLDYLKELGIGAIWLSPFYKSPMIDGGYDIADHTAVDPGLGTVEDIELLIQEAHKRDIKLLCDLVPNHTSDQHEWFQQSLQSPEGEYGDFYIWKNAREILPGEPALPHNIVGDERLGGLPDGYTVPNNWSSIFSEPERVKLQEQYGGKIPDDIEVPARTAWVWSTERQQFYLAEFAKEQPSLNWQNPKVREAMGDVMRFWLDKGIDGFRVDVVNHIGKDPEFRDEILDESYDKNNHNPHDQWKQERLVSYWPTLEGYVREIIGVLDDYPGTRLVLEDWITALSGGEDRLSQLRPDKAVVFNFARLLQTNRESWDAHTHKKLLDGYYKVAEFVKWGNQVDSNHDVDRVVTRLGVRAARVAALIKFALPGNPYVFQGEEAGLENLSYTHIPPQRRKDDDLGLRDGERSPIPWSNSPNAGFSHASEAELWLPITPDYPQVNIADQKRDPRSFYGLYRAAIAERNHASELRYGGYNPMETDHLNVLAFGRALDDGREQYTVAANLSNERTTFGILNPRQGLAKVALSSLEGLMSRKKEVQLGTGLLTLEPHEAVLLRSQ